MPKENLNQEFKLKKIDEIDYSTKVRNQNKLMI